MSTFRKIKQRSLLHLIKSRPTLPKEKGKLDNECRKLRESKVRQKYAVDHVIRLKLSKHRAYPLNEGRKYRRLLNISFFFKLLPHCTNL